MRMEEIGMYSGTIQYFFDDESSHNDTCAIAGIYA